MPLPNIHSTPTPPVSNPLPVIRDNKEDSASSSLQTFSDGQTGENKHDDLCPCVANKSPVKAEARHLVNEEDIRLLGPENEGEDNIEAHAEGEEDEEDDRSQSSEGSDQEELLEMDLTIWKLAELKEPWLAKDDIQNQNLVQYINILNQMILKTVCYDPSRYEFNSESFINVYKEVARLLRIEARRGIDAEFATMYGDCLRPGWNPQLETGASADYYSEITIPSKPLYVDDDQLLATIVKGEEFSKEVDLATKTVGDQLWASLERLKDQASTQRIAANAEYGVAQKRRVALWLNFNHLGTQLRTWLRLQTIQKDIQKTDAKRVQERVRQEVALAETNRVGPPSEPVISYLVEDTVFELIDGVWVSKEVEPRPILPEPKFIPGDLVIVRREVQVPEDTDEGYHSVESETPTQEEAEEVAGAEALGSKEVEVGEETLKNSVAEQEVKASGEPRLFH